MTSTIVFGSTGTPTLLLQDRHMIMVEGIRATAAAAQEAQPAQPVVTAIIQQHRLRPDCTSLRSQKNRKHLSTPLRVAPWMAARCVHGPMSTSQLHVPTQILPRPSAQQRSPHAADHNNNDNINNTRRSMPI